MDMNPLVTPQTCLSDCLNGTIITFNGNEFTLQNDVGNVAINGGDLPEGFIPVGMKEYGGVVYTALLNPVTNVCLVGSIPSPNYDAVPKDLAPEGVLISFDGTNFKDNTTKLFEFEQLALNPGDKYKIVYKVSPTGNDISKIYNVQWLAIDELGKEFKLNNPNVVYDESGDYKFLEQTIRSILGIQITLNNIDWFEASGFSTKVADGFLIKLNLFGRNRIQRTTDPEDDLYIRGCKVDYTVNGVTTTRYIWDKELFENSNPSEDLLKDSFEYTITLPEIFEESQDVDFAITPFDKFTYLDNLSRTLFIKTGENYPISGINDLFQYKYSSANKSLRLDFNANLRGVEDYVVYLEFYDVWSDYSVIVPVNDPNPFGRNTLFLSTSSEKCVKEFTDDNRGGVSTSQLREYSDDIYKATLNGEDSLVRTNQILRENNLYIVKITIVENPLNPDTRKFINTYKAFTLNSRMNSLYDEYQLTDNDALKDFTTISTTLTNASLLYSLETSFDGEVVSLIDNSLLSVRTNNYYYELSEEDLTLQTETAKKNLNKQREYDVNVKFTADDIGYGLISGYTLLGSPQVISTVHNIVDTNSTVNSSSEVTVRREGDVLKLNHTLFTERNTIASIQKESRAVRSLVLKKSVWDTMATLEDEPIGHIKVFGSKHNPRRITLGDTTNTIVENSSRVGDGTLTDFLNNQAVKNASPNILENGNFISGGVLYWKNTDQMSDNFTDSWGTTHSRWCVSKIKSSGNLVPDYINKYLICLRSDNIKDDSNNDVMIPVYVNDKDAAVAALKDIYVAKSQNMDYRLYYYTVDSFLSNEATQATPEVKILIQPNVEFIQYIKSLNEDASLETVLAKLNQLIKLSDDTGEISSASAKYLKVIDEKGPLNITVPLLPMTIMDGGDQATLNKLSNSKLDLETYEASKLTEYNGVELQPFSENYSQVASKFKVSVSDTNVLFKYTHKNVTRSYWAVEKAGGDEDGYRIDTSILEI